MNKETLDRANKLNELINITSTALEGLNKIKSDNSNYYWLNISKHRDGSGGNCELYRSEGNLELMNVIEKELKRQLDAFKKEFSEL